MLKIIFIVFVLAAAVFAGFVALQPAEFQIERAAEMSAAPAVVFAQVNDFHYWQAWSPWAALDPQAKNSYEGPAAGSGAVFRWAGNKDVGEGSMTITESLPSERIKIKLDFIKPFKSASDVQFTFKPEGEKTVVTWSMSGKNNFIGKAMSLVFNCDKMVGGQFEKGLSSLKTIAEAPAVPV